jgi:hypothetical protein
MAGLLQDLPSMQVGQIISYIQNRVRRVYQRFTAEEISAKIAQFTPPN